LALHAVTVLYTIKIIKVDSTERNGGNENFGEMFGKLSAFGLSKNVGQM
jgi:hypothetical protein